MKKLSLVLTMVLFCLGITMAQRTVTGTVTDTDGKSIVMSRKAKLVIVSKDGRELQEHSIEYGSTVLVKDGQEIEKGRMWTSKRVKKNKRKRY